MGLVRGARRGVRLSRRHCCTREARVPRSRRSQVRDTWRVRGGRLRAQREAPHPLPSGLSVHALSVSVSCANSHRWERMRMQSVARAHSTRDTREQIIRHQIIDSIATGEASDSRRCTLLVNIVVFTVLIVSSQTRTRTLCARPQLRLCRLSVEYSSSVQCEFCKGRDSHSKLQSTNQSRA